MSNLNDGALAAQALDALQDFANETETFGAALAPTEPFSNEELTFKLVLIESHLHKLHDLVNDTIEKLNKSFPSLGV